MSNAVSIKGTREGLTISVGPGSLPELIQELKDHLATQGAFFRGGAVALHVGDRAIDADVISQVSSLLEAHEMVLRTVISSSVLTQQAAQSLGLRLGGPEPALPPAPTSPEAPPAALPPSRGVGIEGSRGTLLRQVVRSGQVVRHSGHIVVLGDVNPGAQVIAGGDVIIWGRLLGTVHAGAPESNSAVICALEMSPQLLRIGSVVARPDSNGRHGRNYAETASVRDGTIAIDAWNRQQRGR